MGENPKVETRILHHLIFFFKITAPVRFIKIFSKWTTKAPFKFPPDFLLMNADFF